MLIFQNSKSQIHNQFKNLKRERILVKIIRIYTNQNHNNLVKLIKVDLKYKDPIAYFQREIKRV